MDIERGYPDSIDEIADLGSGKISEELYPIHYDDDLDKSMTFWAKKYLIYKIGRLSKRFVDNSFVSVGKIMDEVEKASNMEELKESVLNIARMGMMSVKNYYYPIERFFKFLKRHKARSMLQIEQRVMEFYIARETDPLSVVTKHNHIVVLTDFCNYVERYGTLEDGSPHFFNIDKKELDAIAGKPVQKFGALDPQKEFDLFLEKGIGGLKSARDRLILKMILLGGLRVHELLGLTPKAVTMPDEETLSVTVVGKGNTIRKVHYDYGMLADDWCEWMERRGAIGTTTDDALFLTSKGKRLWPVQVTRLVQKALMLSGIERDDLKSGPHMLRHSFATYMIYKGFDVSVVQKILGHASIVTTQKYLHHSDGVIRSAKLRMENGRSGRPVLSK